MIDMHSDRRNHKVFKDLGKLNQTTRQSIRDAWFDVGEGLEKEANAEILKKNKRGRIYIVRSRSTGNLRKHRSSAAKQTHANLFGDLRRSISWKQHGADSMDFGYGVSVTAKNKAPIYDKAIEFGRPKTNSYGRIRPRPSLKNAIRAEQRNTENYFRKSLLKGFKVRKF